MKLSIQKIFITGLTLLCVSNVSFAGTLTDCATAKDNNWGNQEFDYGDASGYGQACHESNAWQQLGTSNVSLNGDNGGDRSGVDNIGWTEETSQNAVDSGDNGVQWRVKGTDTWGNNDFAPGDTLEFKFVVTRSDDGLHDFDKLKAWIDWDNSKTFDETPSEIIIDENWDKSNGSGDIQKDFVTEINVPVDAIIGDTWLRARVVCEETLNNNFNGTLIATGYGYQGEVEDYKLTINHVPEPTTLLVFGSALFGLMFSRKKSA